MNNNIYIPLRDKIEKVILDAKKRREVWESFENELYSLPVDADEAFGEVPENPGISIADVLRAIDYTDGDSTLRLLPEGSFVEWDDGADNWYVCTSWNLALPLHEQSDELGEWLMTVIK